MGLKRGRFEKSIGMFADLQWRKSDKQRPSEKTGSVVLTSVDGQSLVD